jgi:RsbT co-antagonist protein rsbRD N-terminal domain
MPPHADQAEKASLAVDDRRSMTKIPDSAVSSQTDGTGVLTDVAEILERELNQLIKDWLHRVDQEEDLTSIPLSFEDRTGHLPALLHDVIARLRLDAKTKAPISEAAGLHGDLRYRQGYTVAMVVEESRLLQVTIFTLLHENEQYFKFATLLPQIVTIADEVDSQLKQQMLRFMAAEDGKKTRARAKAKAN